MWKVINSGPKDAQILMDLDKKFLEELTVPTLHLYRFKNPSLTYGLLMKPEEHLNMELLKEKGIEAAIRPTGGGALFHLWDLAFSVIVPLEYIPHLKTTLDRYQWINGLVKEAIQPWLSLKQEICFLDKTPEGLVGERFCMAKPTIFDVMVDHKKCVGAAQRVTKKALLHQGTISICMPDFELLKSVLIDQEVASKMNEQSFSLAHFDYHNKTKLKSFQDELEKALEATFQKHPL